MHRKVFGQEEGCGLLQHPQLASMPWTRQVHAGLQQQCLLGGTSTGTSPRLAPTPLPQNLPLGSCPAEQRPCRALPAWVLHWLWVEAGALPAMQQLGVQESC